MHYTTGTVKVATIQMQMSRSVEENIAHADELVHRAQAQIILLPELFERQYFCQERRYDYYAYAKPVSENDAVQHFLRVTQELQCVVPISFYEKDENVLYNSVAVLDCGKLLGIYRKTHIPDDHFYQEKFYINLENIYLDFHLFSDNQYQYSNNLLYKILFFLSRKTKYLHQLPLCHM